MIGLLVAAGFTSAYLLKKNNLSISGTSTNHQIINIPDLKELTGFQNEIRANTPSYYWRFLPGGRPEDFTIEVTLPNNEKVVFYNADEFIKFRINHWYDNWTDYNHEWLMNYYANFKRQLMRKIKDEYKIAKMYDIPNPRYQSKQSIAEKLEELRNEYYKQQYLYDNYMNSSIGRYDYLRRRNDFNITRLNKSRDKYEAYLKLLLNNQNIMNKGKNIRAGDELLNHVGEGLYEGIFNKDTMVGALTSLGGAYLMTPICLAGPVGAIACGVVGAVGVIQTLNTFKEKDQMSNLMAYLYGLDSDAYTEAKKGQIIFGVQTAVNFGAGAAGSYMSYKNFISQASSSTISYHNYGEIIVDSDGNFINWDYNYINYVGKQISSSSYTNYHGIIVNNDGAIVGFDNTFSYEVYLDGLRQDPNFWYSSVEDLAFIDGQIVNKDGTKIDPRTAVHFNIDGEGRILIDRVGDHYGTPNSHEGYGYQHIWEGRNAQGGISPFENYGFKSPFELARLTQDVTKGNIGVVKGDIIKYTKIIKSPNSKLVKVDVLYSIKHQPPSLQTIEFKGSQK